MITKKHTLKKIICPLILLYASWRYDDDKIPLVAMDGDDAQRVHLLIKDNVLVDVVAGHDVYYGDC